MTSDRKLDDAISRWLEEAAPTGLPQRVLAATFERTRGSRQQADWRGLLGRRPMPRVAPALGGAAAVVLAAVLAVSVAPLIGPAATPTPAPSSSTGPMTRMWPQTTLEEVQAAQDLVDAGDALYEWQVDNNLQGQLGQHHPGSGASSTGGAEIFQRFLREKLGWENYRWVEAFAHPEGLRPGEVVYVRCAAGTTNPLYPADPRGCAPTLDELRYETVRVTAARPARDGIGGIWVVADWRLVDPVAQADPRVVQAEGEAILEAFLQARVDGDDAEGFAEIADDPVDGELVDRSIPLMYATSSGAPYDRFEFDLGEAAWPSGSMQVNVRLLAEGDRTVVEQPYSLLRDDSGRMRLVYLPLPYGPEGPVPATTENGAAVPVTFRFLDGAVTFAAAHPLGLGEEDARLSDGMAIAGLLPNDGAPRRVLAFLADPRPIEEGCVEAAAPADADALARSFESDPGFEVTASADVSIGGMSGRQLDVRLAPAMSCLTILKPRPLEPGLFGAQTRARLYLLDLPAGSARVLAIAIGADDDSFETVLEWAAPVVASIEFHAP